MKNTYRDRGSTTVFLCLVSGVMLILVISLISVMRFRWEKTQIVRSANVSVRAEFSRYYRPLYDNYRMFYYVSPQKERFDAGVAGYFLKNQESMPGLLRLSLSGIDVCDKKYAVGSEAVNVRRQMGNAAKYRLGETLFNNAFNDINNIHSETDGTDKALESVIDEIDEAKEMAVVEGRVLELLKTVEGVSVSGGGIKTFSHFVKEGVTGSVTPNNAGVDSGIIWKKVKPGYWIIDEMPRKLSIILKEAAAGNDVKLPVSELSAWKDSILEIKTLTDSAYRLAQQINSEINSSDRFDMICDINAFETYLTENSLILGRAADMAERAGNAGNMDSDGYREWLEECRDVIKSFESYHVSELKFDYSSLSHEEVEDPRKCAGKSVNGILNLLVGDKDGISKKSVSESDVYAGLIKDETGKCKKSKFLFDDDFDGLQEFLGECRCDRGESKDNSGDLQEAVGVYIYAGAFFDNYWSGTERRSGKKDGEDTLDGAGMIKDRALDYEMEYILAGEKTDEKNLKEVVNQIIMMRTGVSMMALISDNACRGRAYATAAALVGFTGMDALVRCVQYSIMAAWAYEDACVDAAVILGGKKIPPVKNGNLNISYEEIMMFGRELVQEKAAESSCVQGMDYNSFINSLLTLKGASLVTYRSMDLIQFNMKSNFSGRFSFQDCLYGATVSFSCDRPFECSAAVSFAYE